MEYRYYPAVSYSSFSRWLKSPDHALMPFKESEATLLGKCFEDHLESSYKGKANEWQFKDITGSTLISAINNPEIKAKSPKHNEAVEMVLAGGKIAPDSFKEQIDKMLSNIEKAEITTGLLYGIKASDVLTGAYQVEAYGTYANNYEIPIKAKYDIVYRENIYDIKTTSNIDGFKWSYRDGYWIQDYIYSLIHGTRLVFLVVETVEPFTAKFAYRNNDFSIFQQSEFKRIEDYWEWVQDGKKPLGWQRTELL